MHRSCSHLVKQGMSGRPLLQATHLLGGSSLCNIYSCAAGKY